MRQTYYEPQVGDTEQIQMRGFPVPITGTYVLLDDVISALRSYAQAYEESAVDEAATWLGSGRSSLLPPYGEQLPVPQLEQVSVESGSDPDVDRIEVYPDDPDAIRPRWIARACDATGKILHNTNGSFDQEYVIRDAGERWPGAPVHLVADYSHDTVWEENDPGGLRSVHTKRRRPSPNRLWR